MITGGALIMNHQPQLNSCPLNSNDSSSLPRFLVLLCADENDIFPQSEQILISVAVHRHRK
jgi:hypothetical protein